jgi:hypothetical protein
MPTQSLVTLTCDNMLYEQVCSEGRHKGLAIEAQFTRGAGFSLPASPNRLPGRIASCLFCGFLRLE